MSFQCSMCQLMALCSRKLPTAAITFNSKRLDCLSSRVCWLCRSSLASMPPVLCLWRRFELIEGHFDIDENFYSFRPHWTSIAFRAALSIPTGRISLNTSQQLIAWLLIIAACLELITKSNRSLTSKRNFCFKGRVHQWCQPVAFLHQTLLS